MGVFQLKSKKDPKKLKKKGDNFLSFKVNNQFII